MNVMASMAIVTARPLARSTRGYPAGLVHTRQHPAAEDIAIGIGVRGHCDNAHGERAAWFGFFDHDVPQQVVSHATALGAGATTTREAIDILL